jgi:predicted transposase YbfD/YdcC
VTYKGRDIFAFPVSSSGVQYSALLDWIYAAKWANYKTHEFFSLDGKMQSTIVAAYRAHNQTEAVLAEEQRNKMRSQAARGKSGSHPKGGRH